MKPVRHVLPCLLIAMSAAACLPAAGFLLRPDADGPIAEAEANRALFP